MEKKNAAKYLAIGGLAIALGIASITAAHAATSATGTNPMSSLVQAIAQKFNLSSADVQQVFDQQHAQMDAQRSQAMTDRINQAVTDGKLTQDQASKILAKKAELEALHKSLEGAADERTAMKTQMESLKQWATDNNIPVQYLFFMGGHGMKGGAGHFMRPASGN